MTVLRNQVFPTVLIDLIRNRGDVTLMRRQKVRYPLGLEEFESRSMLSGATLSTHTYNLVVANVQRTIVNLIRTHDVGQATASLTNLAAMIPSGSQELAPVWLSDLAHYNPAGRASGVAVSKQLLKDLREQVVEGVATGDFKVTGPDGPIFTRLAQRSGLGAPQSAADSVTIANNTGLNITVTANLTGTNRSITRMIGVKGSAPFNFGSNTNNYISVTIRRTDNGSPPTPYTTTLNRPISGYHGKLFTVSIFNGFFSVSQ